MHIEWVNRTFLEMRAKGRWLAQQGLDVSAIMGDICPTLHPHPHSREDDAVDFWTVSRWAARFVDSFPNISHADRLACWVVIFVTFQVWLLLIFDKISYWIGLTAYSGKYAQPERRIERFQTGIDRLISSAMCHIRRAWTS